MRRHRTTGGVQMFSFLDAMVCTMGALLVLVHAFARHGEVQAVKNPELRAARENLAATMAEIETLDWTSEQLRAVRDKTQGQLAGERQKLAHVEDHQRRLVARLEALKIAAGELERSSGSRARANDQVAAELAQVKARAEGLRADVEQARKSAAEGNVNYSVVPYEGPNATRRRPIYIECRGDSIVLQPEGVAILPDDFAGYLGPGNPLATAVRATSEYWAQQASGGRAPEPYPLLLVRPEGVQSYYDARMALASWGSDFGYELIGGDWKLSFPQRDQQLAQIEREAVADAAVRMRALVNSMAHMNRRRSRTALHASASGGFVEDRRYSGEGGRGRSAAPDWNAVGSGWARGEHETMGDGPAPGLRGGSANPFNGRGGSVATEGSGPGGSGDDFALRGSRYGDDSGGQGDSGTTGRGTSKTTAGNPSGKLGGPFGTDGESGEDSKNTDSASASRYAKAEQRGARSSSAAAANNQQLGANANSSDNAQTGSPALGTAMGDSQTQSSYVGASASIDTGPKKKPGRSMAMSRGNNWGLPESNGTAAATRPIAVVCDHDRLVIVPEDRNHAPIEVRLSEHTQDSMDEFVSGVWQHMKTWGTAGKGLYWRPTLVMDVKPGAADRYAEVKGLLADSGLDVQERRPATVAQPPTRPANRK